MIELLMPGQIWRRAHRLYDNDLEHTYVHYEILSRCDGECEVRLTTNGSGLGPDQVPMMVQRYSHLELSQRLAGATIINANLYPRNFLNITDFFNAL